MSKSRFKFFETLSVNRKGLINELNFTVLVYGLAVMLVEARWPDVSLGVRFVRFYLLTVAAGWFIQRSVYNIPKPPQIVSVVKPGSPSS